MREMLHQKSLVKIEKDKIKVVKSLNVCEMFCKKIKVGLIISCVCVNATLCSV